jgi:hypothetical protein
MKIEFKIGALLLLLTATGTIASAQDLAPVVERTENAMKKIELTDRIIEKTFYDFVYPKVNNSGYFYTYELRSAEVYHLTFLGDATRASSGNVKIYQSVNGEWKLATQYNSPGVDFNIKFSPSETALYEMVYTCTVRDQVIRAGVGLIIDSEK